MLEPLKACRRGKLKCDDRNREEKLGERQELVMGEDYFGNDGD